VVIIEIEPVFSEYRKENFIIDDYNQRMGVRFKEKQTILGCFINPE